MYALTGLRWHNFGMENQPHKPFTNYTELNEVLSQFPDDKQYAAYMRIKRAIREGHWRAVPTFEWVDIPRKGGALRVPNLLIEAVFDAWVGDTLADLSGKKKKYHPHAVTPEQLASGKVSFDEMAQKYMESLQPKRKKRKARTHKAEATPKTEQHTPAE